MFVRLGEECSLVAYEIVKAIENVTIFGDFVKLFDYRTYGVGIFLKSADNRFSGCTVVVGTNSRKWGHFGV